LWDCRRPSNLHLAARRVVCVEAVNLASDFTWGKKLIGSGREVSASALANVEVDLATLLV
jgi:hypothetical protein